MPLARQPRRGAPSPEGAPGEIRAKNVEATSIETPFQEPRAEARKEERAPALHVEPEQQYEALQDLLHGIAEQIVQIEEIPEAVTRELHHTRQFVDGHRERIVRTLRLRRQLPTFEVKASHIRHAVLSMNQAEMAPARGTVITESMVLLRELMHEFFSINTQEYSALQERLHGMKTGTEQLPVRQEGQSLDQLKKKFKLPSSIRKGLEIGSRVAGAVIGVATASAVAVVSPAGRLALTALQYVAPKAMMRYIMKKTMLRPTEQQRPGSSSMVYEQFARRFVRYMEDRRHGLSAIHNVYTITNTFDRYNAKRDRFEQSHEGREVRPYTTTTLFHSAIELQERYNVLTSTIEHIDPTSLEDEKTGLVPLPRATSLADVDFIPVGLRVEDLRGDREPQDAQLYYDEHGRLYADLRSWKKEGARDLRVRTSYATVFPGREMSTVEPIHLSRLRSLNPGYFDHDEPALDADTVETDFSFPKELEEKMAEWIQLPTNEMKVDAVHTFLHHEFFYGTGIMAKMRIAAARGKNTVERVAHAKEGNCFDVDKIGYIILQKIGVPTRFHVGFAPDEKPTDRWNRKKAQHLDVSEIQPGTMVGHEQTIEPFEPPEGTGVADVSIAHGHAFVSWWDPGKKKWQIRDMTPYVVKNMDYVLDESISRRDQRRLEARENRLHLPSLQEQRQAFTTSMQRYKASTTLWRGKKERIQCYSSRRSVQATTPWLYFTQWEGRVYPEKFPPVLEYMEDDDYVHARRNLGMASEVTEMTVDEYARAQKEIVNTIQDSIRQFVRREQSKKNNRELLRADLRPYLARTEERLNNEEQTIRALIRFVVGKTIPLPEIGYVAADPVSGKIWFARRDTPRGILNTGDPEQTRSNMQLLTPEEMQGVVQEQIAVWKKDALDRARRLVQFIEGRPRGSTLADIDNAIRVELFDQKQPKMTDEEYLALQWLTGATVLVDNPDATEKKRGSLVTRAKKKVALSGTVVESDGEHRIEVQDPVSGKIVRFHLAGRQPDQSQRKKK